MKLGMKPMSTAYFLSSKGESNVHKAKKCPNIKLSLLRRK